MLRWHVAVVAALLCGVSAASAQQSIVAPGSSAATGVATISTSGSDCTTVTNCAVFDVRSVPSLGVYLNVGSSGTFNFEATIDGATWFSINDDVGGNSSATADGALFFTNPGYASIRLRASAISGAAAVAVIRGLSGLRSTASLSGSSQGDGALQDGASSSIEATVLDLTNANPLTVAITDASGDQVTSFGGGTQYDDGDADATPTGTVSFGFDGTNVQALSTNSSGQLTVNLGATDNAVLDSIADGIAVTQSGTWNLTNISGTISLPTGAATAAKQPALGTAGSPSTDVISIQGVASGTAVPVSGSVSCSNCSGSGASAVDDAAFTVATDSGAPSMGIFDDTSPDSVDEGDVGVLRMTANRQLKVTLFDSGGTELSQDTQLTHDGALTPASTTGGALFFRASSAAPTAVSASDDAVLPWADLSGRLHVTGDSSMTALKVDGSGVTQPVSGTVTVNALPAGTNNIGDVDLASAIPAGNNNIGDVDVATLPALAAGTNAIGVLARCGDPASVQSVAISTASSGSTQLVALTASQTVYVCGYNFMAGGTANVKLVYGTGTNCGTGSTDLTGAYPLIAQTGVSVANGGSVQTKTAASNALCINLSAAVQVSGLLTYVKF